MVKGAGRRGGGGWGQVKNFVCKKGIPMNATIARRINCLHAAASAGNLNIAVWMVFPANDRIVECEEADARSRDALV